MAIKDIINYKFREIALIPMIWPFLYQNPSDEDEAYSLQRSCTPKVCLSMTLTMTLALQNMDFERKEALDFSPWRWKTTD